MCPRDVIGWSAILGVLVVVVVSNVAAGFKPYASRARAGGCVHHGESIAMGSEDIAGEGAEGFPPGVLCYISVLLLCVRFPIGAKLV